ncbi:phage virion morphogenesis protein [Enterobacter sp. C2]|uniref:phage virion morphogenesis protein n=1 Tax=Enterobacter sp. C2 TaxID=2870346 RepID=UPI001CA41185|nr:phage virion morphogenesis protein [Enterobacter sp. C2]
MNDLQPFEDKLAALIAMLSPSGRRRMAADIAKRVRAGQQKRIKSQKAPDGTPYEARKRQPVKAKNGRVKRQMFAKLRTSRYMKASGEDSAAAVEFTGKVQRIARVHQFGLKDRPGRDSPAVQYPERKLLGFSDDDEKIIELILISYLAD